VYVQTGDTLMHDFHGMILHTHRCRQRGDLIEKELYEACSRSITAPWHQWG
jgi:hypothetical protein